MRKNDDKDGKMGEIIAAMGGIDCILKFHLQNNADIKTQQLRQINNILLSIGNNVNNHSSCSVSNIDTKKDGNGSIHAKDVNGADTESGARNGDKIEKVG